MSLALYGLGHVLLLLAQSAATTAGAYERDVSLRSVADQGIAEVLRDGLGLRPELVQIRTDTVIHSAHPPFTTERTMLRLSEESWLVTARAEHTGGSFFASRTMVWIPSASARVAMWPFAIVLGPGSSADLGGIVDGDVPPVGPATNLTFGPVTIPDMVSHSPPLLEMEDPEPSQAGGECVQRPSNWGAPSAPGHPCFDRWVVRARWGNSLVRSGEGQGLLVVDGDLTLESTTFHGVVFATGRVTLSAGTVVVGRIVALGGFQSEPGTTVTGSSRMAQAGVSAAISIWPPAWPLHPARSLGPW